MADNTAQNLKKKKEKKEKLKQVVVSILFGILILVMVVSLVPYAMRTQQNKVRVTKIAKINRSTYDYLPNSVFSRIYSEQRENLIKKYQNTLPEDLVAQVSFSQSVQLLVNYALVYDFCRSVGITPSQELLRAALSGYNGIPPTGIKQYVAFNFANQTLMGQNGDIMNAASLISIGELSTYFDLVNFTAKAEVLYVDVTNYIIGKVSMEEASAYYTDNLSAYADRIVVNDLAVSNKSLSREVFLSVKSNGWDAALQKYADRAVYSPVLILSNAGKMAKRYTASIVTAQGSVNTNVVYENGLYHIIQVVSFPEFALLSPDAQKAIRTHYVMKNFAELKSKYLSEIQALVSSARDRAAGGQSFSSVAAAPGIQYADLGSISPINLILKDAAGNTLDLPILDKPECMDFLFTSPVGTVSQVFPYDSYYLVMKLNYRGENQSIDYSDPNAIDQQIAYRYMNYKDQTIIFDWFSNLKTNSMVTIFSNSYTNLM